MLWVRVLVARVRIVGGSDRRREDWGIVRILGMGLVPVVVWAVVWEAVLEWGVLLRRRRNNRINPFHFG